MWHFGGIIALIPLKFDLLAHIMGSFSAYILVEGFDIGESHDLFLTQSLLDDLDVLLSGRVSSGGCIALLLPLLSFLSFEFSFFLLQLLSL